MCSMLPMRLVGDPARLTAVHLVIQGLHRSRVRYKAGLQPAEDLARTLCWAFNRGWYETGRWPEAMDNACDGGNSNCAVMRPVSFIVAYRPQSYFQSSPTLITPSDTVAPVSLLPFNSC